MPNRADPMTNGAIGLPSRMDHAAVGVLRREIEAARGGALCLQADEVDFLGGAGLELLLAARAEWQANALDFSISSPSGSLLEGLDRLGIPRSELLNEGCE